MIETKELNVSSILADAIEKACNQNKSQFISITKKIEKQDPFLYFEAAKQINKDRIFWLSTDEEFYLVGLGSVHEITAGEESRFSKTEKQWRQFLEEAIIYNPHQAPGTGVTALGGMDFDPRKEKSKQWENFKPSQFTVPEYMLAHNVEGTYFTVNMVVDKDSETADIVRQIRETEDIFAQTPKVSQETSSIEKTEEMDPQKWKQKVSEAKEEIKQGKAEKIVLARQLYLKFNQKPDIASILQLLEQTQNNSYIFAFEKDDTCFIGATPERLVKLSGDELLSTCLAGTAPRGETAEEDQRLANQLLMDKKNRQEHQLVVQMIKNAMNHYCSVLDIPENPTIRPLKNMQHLYTPVRGTLKSGYSIFNVIEELHPTPALGGLPKEASLEFIRKRESLDRGWYGAPIGWMDSNRNGEFAVAIRSGLIQGYEASLFAGCGIVADSDPEEEYRETSIKLQPMLSVLGGEQ